MKWKVRKQVTDSKQSLELTKKHSGRDGKEAWSKAFGLGEAMQVTS